MYSQPGKKVWVLPSASVQLCFFLHLPQSCSRRQRDVALFHLSALSASSSGCAGMLPPSPGWAETSLSSREGCSA